MNPRLSIAIGRYSVAGAKPSNQDFHGSLAPEGELLAAKGVAVAMADGISSSPVGAIASEIAVKSFLEDYFCTSEAWSVKTSAERVIAATNAWLHAQNGHVLDDRERERGHVCTFDAIVFKSDVAHVFHIGDGRIYRAAQGSLEQLTQDHRVVISSHEVFLARAMGANLHVEVDYRAVKVQPGDVFVQVTDGVHEHVTPAQMSLAIKQHQDDLEAAARRIVHLAAENGSRDNLTIQIARVQSLPEGRAIELLDEAEMPPPAPLLGPGVIFDGYKIMRTIHDSSRSHIYLASDLETGGLYALKVPSVDLQEDPAYLRRFMMEEWIARRLNNPHVLRAGPRSRPRSHLYIVTEYFESQTLAQWMRDHPKPDLATVRGLVEQAATGIQAFHRKEMVHQDLRPENILVDRTGTVKIADFGSTWVAGVAEFTAQAGLNEILGTAQYTAPEYFRGKGGSERSDIYSLGVMTYQMLTGRLPYGPRVANQRKLRYTPARLFNAGVPDWVDGAIEKAVHPDPERRYQLLSHFLFDFSHPNPALGGKTVLPFFQRDPAFVWRSVSALLFAVILLLLWQLLGRA